MERKRSHTIKSRIRNQLRRFTDATQRRIAKFIVLLLRKGQSRFYQNISYFQDRYELYPEGSFRSLYVQIMYHWNKSIYWFCVANAWVEGSE